MSSSKLAARLSALAVLLACLWWAAPAYAIACNSAGGTCFVVAAGGNSGTTTTWSNSSGGATCTCAPTTTSLVILDSLAGQLTINSNLSIGTLDASGTGGSGSPYTNTLTQASNATLTINTAATNSLKFSTQMTYSPGTAAATQVIFANTSGTAQITSSGKIFTTIVMNGVGGTAQQLDDIIITNGVSVTTGALVVTNGIWDANTHKINATSIFASNSNVRSLILGDTVTLGGNIVANGTVWSVSTAGTFTFTKNSANIVVNVPSPALQGVTFAGAGLTYNGLTLTANTGANVALTVTGGNTFSSITVGSGWNWAQTSATTTTLSASGTFTATGTQANRVLISSLSFGAVATISAPAGTCASTWVILQGVTATGGCTFTATNSIDLGTNAGWTITVPGRGPLGGGV